MTGSRKTGFALLVSLTTSCLALLYGGCTPAPQYTRNSDRPYQQPREQPVVEEEAREQGASLPFHPEPSGGFRQGQLLRGVASYYGPGFHGRLTANGEVYDQNGLTCAHKHLPFNTILEITYLGNGRKVRVRVNDRGPFVHGRIIDLSVGAARALGLMQDGVGEITAEIVRLGEE